MKRFNKEAFIHRYDTPDKDVLARIALITKSAADTEQGANTFPYEDSIIYLMDDNTGFIAYCPYDECSYEACAFVAPVHRGKGIFASLMEASALDMEDFDIIWQVHEGNESAMAVLDSLEAEMICENLMMELDLAAFAAPDNDTEKLSFRLEDSTYHFFYNKKPVGLCHIEPTGEKICFYDFEIREDCRNRGYGEAAFNLVANDLKEKGWKAMILHVEGDNVPAVKVYRKAGFKVIEKVFTYVY